MKNELKVAKWLLAVFIVVLILGIGTAAWYLWQARTNVSLDQTTKDTNSTADWKTYENTDLRFSFKYPSDWRLDISVQNKISLESPKTQSAIKQIKEEKIAVGGPADDITIYIYNSISEIDTKAVGLSAVLNNENLFTNVNKIILAGKEAFEANNTGMFGSYNIIVQLNSKILKIDFGSVSDKSKLTVEQNQILSTFNFTDSISTTDWKTYENKELGIGFKYPVEYGEIEEKTIKGVFLSDGSRNEAGSLVQLNFSKNSYIESCAVTPDFKSDRGDRDICWVTALPQKDGLEVFQNMNDKEVFIDQDYDFFASKYVVGYVPLSSSSKYISLTISTSYTKNNYENIKAILNSAYTLN